MAKVLLRVGDPKKPTEVKEEAFYGGGRTPIDQSFDIRDRLAELIGSGNVLKPDDKAAIYGSLTSTLGADKARKIMDHIYIFNTRNDVKSLPVEEKIKTFYNMGSNDPDVMALINKTKSLAYGPLRGFRESSSDMNQQMAGRTPVVASNGVSPEIQKKVMLRIGK